MHNAEAINVVCEGKPNVKRIRKCVISAVIHGKDPEVSV